MDSGTPISASTITKVYNNTWGTSLNFSGKAGLIWISNGFGSFSIIGNVMYVTWSQLNGATTYITVNSNNSTGVKIGNYTFRVGSITTASASSITVFSYG